MIVRAAAACALLALALAAPAGRVAAEMRDQPAAAALALAPDGGGVRLEVRFTGPAPATRAVFTLDDPPRAVIDLPETDWRGLAPPPPAGLARSVRLGLAAPGRSRIVIDLDGPALPAASVAGDTLTVSLQRVERRRFATAAGWPEGLGPVAAAEPPAPLIVVDPGHGGADPGASGGGALEKDVVLGVARAMADALRAKGFRVAMTREDDSFVPLDARRALARATDADALISIHADAAPQRTLSGASVYTLSQAASDAAAEALARRENAADPTYAALEPDVAAMLESLAAPRTAARSRALGAALLEGLAEIGPTLPARPLRAAAFVVLRGAETPSALVELGYLSNPDDAARLTDPVWAEQAGRALAAAAAGWARAALPPIFRAGDPVLPD
ncbi:N-acetylmuramoyl-L-alanine amidase [Rubrimonas cliftonensis]|uniref:N-acetylmuramoyl-L-alanine amidase n=1 Tax=Rubrimonas cliftonensis TaxID=89524 RepID=A0A1H4BD68_9RHOB|nr:N-acetylmuramoyl-L-alanine amidase [Rubrimonas cliftonensis]